jgi:hypothetical protein
LGYYLRKLRFIHTPVGRDADQCRI